MASLEQRSWLWSGDGNTAGGRFDGARDVLAFDMHGPYPFWTFFARLLHCHNLILQCSNTIPTLSESASAAPHIDARECFPFCSRISFPTRSRRAVRADGGGRLGEQRAPAAPSRSISPSRAAARTALSPGACSISCSTTAGSRSKASPARRRER